MWKGFRRLRRLRRKYLSIFGEYAESIYSKRRWRIWQIRVICGTQNRLRVRGKYLNIFGEYAEGIYAYMEMTQRGPWRILLIRQET